jgi:MraZ protein
LTVTKPSAKVGKSALRWDFVANNVFQGPAALTLDSKGRIAIPARHRELLREMGVDQLTITRHPEGSLIIFPQPTWEAFRERLSTLPLDATSWKRVFLGNAMEVDIDASSRVLIAPELREAAGLVRDVKLIGMGSHLELWDAQRHAEHEAKTLQSALPDSLKNFSY